MRRFLKKSWVKWVAIILSLSHLSLIIFLDPPKRNNRHLLKVVGEAALHHISSDYDFGNELEARNTRPRRRKPRVVVYYKGPELIKRPNLLKIPPGSMVKAELVSGASDGTVKAKLLTDLTINGESLVESGSTLLGKGKSGRNRLHITFNQLISPDGSFRQTSAVAADLKDQIVGLKASRLGYYGTRLLAATGLNFVAGVSEGLQEQEAIGEQVVKKPSMKNALLNGAGHAAIELSRETMNDMKNSPATFEFPPGTEIFVIFSGGK